MLREEVLREWGKLKDDLVSEKFVKAEVDKLQQQEFSQRTNRISVLEEELKEVKVREELFIVKLVYILNSLKKGKRRCKIESKIKEAQEIFLLRNRSC